MLGYKPNPQIWDRVNQAVLNENAAEVLVTLIGGMCGMLIEEKICPDVRSARVHLAAMLLSPDDAPAGSLLPFLHPELARLRDGKWIA